MDKKDWTSSASARRRASWPPRSRSDAYWPAGFRHRGPRLATIASGADGAGSASLADGPPLKVELIPVFDSYSRAILGCLVQPLAGMPETPAQTGDARPQD